MRVGVLTNRNLRSPWASTHFYIQRALRRLGIDAVHVAGKPIVDELAIQQSRKAGRRAAATPAMPFSQEMVSAIREDLQKTSYDILLALHASTLVPQLDVRCPLVYVTDATAALLNQYYPGRQETLSAENLEHLENCEQSTISRADAVSVPTQWAAESVVEDYGANPSRVHIVEWGGNLDGIPQMSERPLTGPDQQLKFLFVGLDWERKGGDIASETMELLNREGIKASLTVVGATIPRKQRSPYVRSVGMLNRANPDESAQLDQLFQSADFYLHPARAECYGHVLCEALGFGVPVIATQTGGISQCVLDGETGLLLSTHATASDFARSIRELLVNMPLRSEMRANAAQDFRQRLNWDHWASRTQQIMQELISPAVSSGSD